MSDVQIHPAGGAARRGLRLSDEGTLIINMHGSPTDLYEIVPGVISGLGPALNFYNIQRGRGPDERRHLMTLTVSGARLLMRYLPVLINNAERLSRRQS